MAKATIFEMQRLIEIMRSYRLGVTYDKIEEEFGCGKRTAQRWIKYLKEEYWAEDGDQDDQGRQRFVLTKAAREAVPIVVTPTELLAQCLAIQAAAPAVAGTELGDALQNVTRKIAAALPRNLSHFGLEALAAFPEAPGVAVKVREELLEDLLEATVRHRILDAEYCPRSLGGKPKRYKLRPLAVFPHKGALYLAAIGGEHAEKRRPFYYAIHRFLDVTVTKETFKPPKGFDARKFVQESFGAFDGPVLDVVVRFSKEIAPLATERTFHATQEITPRDDGSVDVHIRAAGWPEIKGWILSYGKYAELISPKDKRAELARELADAAKIY